jgi:hypothetical protein
MHSSLDEHLYEINYMVYKHPSKNTLKHRLTLLKKRIYYEKYFFFCYRNCSYSD